MECTEDEATLRFEIRAIRRVTLVVRLKCLCSLSDLCSPNGLILHKTTVQRSSSPSTIKFRPSPCWLCHRPLSIYNRHLSSNFSPFTSVSHPSPHEHRTVRIILTVTPIGPLAQKSNGPNGVKGAAEEDKNRRQDLTGLNEWA